MLRLLKLWLLVAFCLIVPFSSWAQASRTTDSLALVDLYNSAGGPQWTDHTNWLQPGAYIDTWFGVTVTGGRVTSLNLSGNHVVGTIPSSIGDLTELNTLMIRGDQVAGLTGSIPASIGNLHKLIVLDFARNFLSGPLPPSLANLNQLQALWLDANPLGGGFPAPVLSLTSLTSLSLSSCQLSGPIPPEVGNLTNMSSFNVIANQLSGPIPAEIANMTNLQLLYLMANQFSGSIPPALANLNLQQAWFNSNQLTGTVPAFVNSLFALSLRLDDNFLTELPNLTAQSFSELTLANNYFTFEDIIPNVSIGGAVIGPQRLIPVPDPAPTVTYGQPYTFQAPVGGTGNVYQWRKNGVNIAGATQATYTIAAVAATDAATYTLRVTHPLVPGLILNSSNIVLSVAPNEPYFQAVTNAVTTDTPAASYGGYWGDYDNDGDEDLFVNNYLGGTASLNYFYTNQGGGVFSKVTSGLLATEFNFMRSASWGDYDNDGDLDLFVGDNGVAFPGVSDNASAIFKNMGDGTFSKITIPQSSEGGAWSDYDKDGDLDLAVFASGLNTILYRNDGADQFVALTNLFNVQTTWTVSWVDVDNDGDEDFFQPGHTSAPTNRLFINNGSGGFTENTSTTITSNNLSLARGCSWGDLDNDGYVDLILLSQGATGQVHWNNGNGTFTMSTLTSVLGEDFRTRSSSLGDVDNDGDLDLFTVNNVGGLPTLFRNNGNRTFTKETAQSFTVANGFSQVSMADYDNDGWLDLFVGNQNPAAGNHMFRNKGGSNHWVKLRLVGMTSNKAAVGTRIRLRTGSVWQDRRISSATGLAGQNSLIVHFGLAAYDTIQEVQIYWPSGVVQSATNIPVDQLSVITEHVRQPQTITFPTIGNLSYGQAPDTLKATASSGLQVQYASSDSTVVKVLGNQLIVIAIGSATITATQAGDENWYPAAPVSQNVTVSLGQQSISFGPLRDYYLGENEFVLVASSNSGLPLIIASSDTTVATVNGGSVRLKERGTTTITITQPGNVNYLPASPVSQTLTVKYFSDHQRIWGTLSNLGPGGAGSVYSVKPGGDTFINSVNFELGPRAASAGNGLTLASNGIIYGTTTSGGANDQGTIFKVNQDGTGYRKIFDFDLATTGANPYSSLTQGADGYLYGATYTGGPNGSGVIFRIGLDGKGYQVIHIFTGTEGYNPYAGVVEGNDGFIYGSTISGGGYGNGTLFKLRHDGTEFAKLADFNYNSGMGRPITKLAVSDGQLYMLAEGQRQTGVGTYNCNCRWVCFWSCSWVCDQCTYPIYTYATSLYRIGTDGSNPTQLAQWDGYNPGSDLVPDASGVIGRVTYGNNGLLFRYSNATGLNYILTGLSANYSYQSIALDGNGTLYGISYQGGTNNYGAMFRINTDGTNYATLHNFELGVGMYPYGITLTPTGKLYTFTSQGGTAQAGRIFAYDLASSTMNVVTDLERGIGRMPRAALVQASDGNLYGTTSQGGVNDRGTIYRVSPEGTGFKILYSFPQDVFGELFKLAEGPDGFLYGTNRGNYGSIFKIDKEGNNFATVFTFDASTGSSPISPLTLGKDGYFYGTVESGGNFSAGAVYRVRPDGTAFQRWHDFIPSTEGSNPRYELALDTLGNVFGVAAGQGPTGYGSLFRIGPDQSFTVLHTFDVNHADPRAVQLSGDGWIYGTTYSGNNYGTVYKIRSDGSDFQLLYTATTPEKGSNFLQASLGGTELYFPAISGGNSGYGTLLKVRLDSVSTTVIKHFNRTTGIYPDYYTGLTLVGPRQDQTITFDAIDSLKADHAPFALASSASSGLPITFTSSDPNVVSISGNIATITGGGFVTITAKQVGSKNYRSVETSQSIFIEKVDQTITFDPIAPHTISSPPFRLVATASSGLPVSFSSGETEVAEIQGDTVTIVSVGTTPITASQAGNSKYNPAASVIQDLVITDPVVRPTVAASGIAFSGVYSTQMSISFAPGNGKYHLVVMKAGSSVDWMPVDNTFYPANSDFSQASDLGNGNKVVRADSSNNVLVTGLLPATNYFIKVFEFNAKGTDAKYLTSGAPSSSKLTLALPNVNVISPANGATNVNLTVSVTAKALTGATTYTLQLSLAPDFGSGIIEKTGSRVQSFAGLVYDTTYYTRVKTNLSPDFGTVTTFHTAAPEFFSYVVTPANNATGVLLTNGNLSVTSNVVPNAVLYTIELNTLANFTGTSIVRSGSKTLSFTGLQAGTTYYNRVKTNLSPNWGVTRQFTTGVFSFVVAPGNNATNVSYLPSVTASSIGASTYTIQLSPSTLFDTGLIENTATSPTMSFSGLQYNTKYYSRVLTNLDPNYGPLRSFTTNSPLTYSYMSSPANNATNVSYVTNITAYTVPGAAQYTIEANTASDFTGTSIVMSGTGRTYSFTLGYNTTYYVRVQTDLLPGQWGATRSFTTNSPLAYSYITAPANGSTNVNYVTNITANAVPTASTYWIEANPDPFFGAGTAIVKTGAARTYSFSLAYNTPYYVRVQTNLLPGQWGAVKSFTTGDPVSLAYVTSPANGATGVPTTVNVTANALTGATTYFIELNLASDFSDTPILKSGGRTQNFAGLQQGRTYYTRVRTNLAPGLWGSTRSFTTVNPAAREAGDYVPTEEDVIILDADFNVTAFPNPFRESLTILVQSDMETDLSFRMVDVNGRVLRESPEKTNRPFRVEGEFAPGIYLIQVSTDSKTRTIKVMKE